MSQSDFVKFYAEYLQKSNRINVDLSYICPLQCPFCARQRDDAKEKIRESEDIPLENFVKLTKKFKRIALVGTYSDPIYHSNFLEILRVMSRTESVRFFISTNGTRKKPDWWKEAFALSKSNISWTFGLDGTDQETANIYRVNTRYEEVMDVMKLGVSMDVDVRWQFIVFRHNEHQIEIAKEIAKENGINLLIVASSWWNKEKMEKYQIFPPSNPEYFSTTAQSKFIPIFAERKSHVK